MRKTINDAMPGAGEARTEYLRSRLDRALGEFHLTAVELKLEEAADGDGVEASLTLYPKDGLPLTLSTQKRSLPSVLESVIEAADYRLRYGTPLKGTTRRRARLTIGAA